MRKDTKVSNFASFNIPTTNERSYEKSSTMPHDGRRSYAKTAFFVLLTIRLTSALFNHISDCDETFNYWEPISKLTFGDGMQTWEYSPVYAIRSYLYLWFYVLPARILQLFVTKLMIFYLIRCLLALTCTACEIIFLKGVLKRFGDQVAFFAFTMLAYSAGMFNSSTAVLPSTFSMYFCFLSFAGYYLNLHRLTLLSIGLSTLVGWPFTAIIGLPILVDMILNAGTSRKFWYLMKWGVIFATIITVLLVFVDSLYYCKPVIAPLNIVLYNVFTSHGANLYGTEPTSFYLINTILNFNLASLFALFALPLCLMFGKRRYQYDSRSLFLTILVFYLWVIVFTLQAHKEERFLFPIYPLICLLAAISLVQLKSFVLGRWLTRSFSIVFIFLSLSRIFAIYTGYHAPLETFAKLSTLDDLHAPDQQLTICLAKEWFRYPSSFFLPNSRWRLGFVSSSFKGQLPQAYSESTCAIQPNFNDLNREETSRYIEPRDCDYLVDSDFSSDSPLDPNYSQQTNDWATIYTAKLIDPTKSSKIFRAFYVPIISPSLNTYVNFNLLRNLNRHFDNSDQVRRFEHSEANFKSKREYEHNDRIFRFRHSTHATFNT